MDSVKRTSCDNSEDHFHMTNYLTNMSIDLATFSAYTPESNSLVERMNRTILSKSRALPQHLRMIDHWWREALKYISVLYNRTVTSNLNGGILHEMLYQNQSRNNLIKLFGCGSYINLHKENRHKKFSGRSDFGVYFASRSGLLRG